MPTVDCLSPLPPACPAALPACLFHVQFSPWLIFDEKFSVSHYSCASATLVALPLLLLLLLFLLCLPATPPCTGFAVEWRLHSLLLFLVFYVFFSFTIFVVF